MLNRTICVKLCCQTRLHSGTDARYCSMSTSWGSLAGGAAGRSWCEWETSVFESAMVKIEQAQHVQKYSRYCRHVYIVLPQEACGGPETVEGPNDDKLGKMFSSRARPQGNPNFPRSVRIDSGEMPPITRYHLPRATPNANSRLKQCCRIRRQLISRIGPGGKRSNQGEK